VAGKQDPNSLNSKVQKIRDRDFGQMRIPWAGLAGESEKFQLFVEKFPLPVAVISKSAMYEYINPKFTDTFGYTLRDIPTGRAWFRRAYPDKTFRKQVISAWLEDLGRYGTGEFRPRTFRVTCKNGEERAILFRSVTLADGRQLIIYDDVTEGERAERALRKSEEKYRSVLESMDEGYFEVDLSGNFTFFNAAVTRMLAYTANELAGMSYQHFVDEENAKEVFETFKQVYKSGQPRQAFNWEIIRKDGTRRFVEASISLIRGDKDQPLGFRGIVRDVTEPRKAEEALRESEERYRQLVNHAPAGIYEVDFIQRKFLTVNDVMCEYTGYTKDEILAMTPFDLLTEDGKRIFIERMTRVLAGEKVPETVEFQIKGKGGRQFWVILNAKLVYENGFPKGATVVVHDISERKKAEDALTTTITKLRKITGATIQAMAQTVEVRDPYTAGHQRRVADLARTIATHMGLDAEKIDGIRMAGAIHDIGKISVPAEILSKPGILTPIEFSLIKTHSQVGYEILKDIEFPWNIAQMVLQHHERMDGSGYPNGLRGDQILLESRILAVADVVEAMASHRPYRPAVGMEKALEEISAKRGLIYDPAAVDVCLRLFKEQLFAFK